MSKREIRKPLWKRVLKGTVLGIISVFCLGILVFYVLWHNEIGTLLSLKEVRERNDAHGDGSVYMMEVKGGFYLDKFVEQGGVKSDTELIEFVTKHMLKGIFDAKISVPDLGCSCFTATTVEGDNLFGRNYDFDRTNTCLVFTEANEGRHASVSTVDLELIGIDFETGVDSFIEKCMCLVAPYIPLDGMNDAGVSCSINMTYQGIGRSSVATDQNTDKPDMTSTTLFRLILDYADNVEEAVEIAKSYDMHDSANTSFHYMVADADGKSVILEWVGSGDIVDNDGSARELVVIYNDDDAHIGEWESGADYQWMTNFIVHPDYYDSVHEKLGYDRYEKIYEELSETDGVVADEWAAMDILRQVGRRTWDPFEGSGTPHSVVYNLTDKSVLWISNENYQDETAIFEFSLE